MGTDQASNTRERNEVERGRGRRTAVRKNDRVSRDEVEADAADGQAGKKHPGGRVRVEGVDGGVAAVGGHGAVDAGVGQAGVLEGRLDEGEERGPLGEYNHLGGRIIAQRGLDNLDEGLDLAAGSGLLGVVLGFGAGFVVLVVEILALWCRVEQLGLVEGVAAQRALVLQLDGARDAPAAKDVLAVRDDGVRGVVEADGAVLVLVDKQAQGLLEQAPVARRQVYRVAVGF